MNRKTISKKLKILEGRKVCIYIKKENQSELEKVVGTILQNELSDYLKIKTNEITKYIEFVGFNQGVYQIKEDEKVLYQNKAVLTLYEKCPKTQREKDNILNSGEFFIN